MYNLEKTLERLQDLMVYATSSLSRRCYLLLAGAPLRAIKRKRSVMSTQSNELEEALQELFFITNPTETSENGLMWRWGEEGIETLCSFIRERERLAVENELADLEREPFINSEAEIFIENRIKQLQGEPHE